MNYNTLEYETKVYSAILGKVIGVYFGRPVEGWTRDRIEKRFGMIDHYVAEELNLPIIVTDDDISGTLTFIHALTDSGLLDKTPADFFGDNWLNYLIEFQTVLWWGGMSRSTEHTAFLRLKQGIRAPESGSMKRNGKVVSEQIGAQIFIDAFGMVAPGNPVLAAELAEKAARVSHDGEAVNGAKVVAAMVAEAFVSSDMFHVLDIGVSVIPEDSLIAQVHRDVRSWVKEDGDWQKTFERISEKYGYSQYGGGCHMIPNHAVMVMAWSYAPNDFYKAMSIVTSAGWDTDCNAANVGSVSALVCGLESLEKPYDFRTPIADRVLIPTADGSLSCSDCVSEAYYIASIGRRILYLPPVKQRAFIDFSLPGSIQGFMAQNTEAIHLFNNGEGLIAEVFSENAQIMRPTLIPAKNSVGAYKAKGTPSFYPGMTAVWKGIGIEDCDVVPVFMSVPIGQTEVDKYLEMPVCHISAGKPFQICVTPDCNGNDTICEIGLKFLNKCKVLLQSVDFNGNVSLSCNDRLPEIGWISTLDTHWGMSMGKNSGAGFFVTGNRRWAKQTIASDFKIHAADRCGIVLRYQGLERFYALMFYSGKAALIKHLYGKETILAEIDFDFVPDQLFHLVLSADKTTISAELPDNNILQATDSSLLSGGVGFYTEMGVCEPANIQINACVENVAE